MGSALRAIDIGRADRGQMIGIAAIMRDTTSRFEELRVLRRHLAVRPATTGAESKNSYHDGTRLRFARDSPLEGAGFELVWGFSCQVVVFGCCRFFVRSGKAVLRPVATIRFAERAEGVKGPKR
jgi:hypothetical protein